MKKMTAATDENAKIPYLQIAQVTAIDDPKHRDRVRVRIMGMISDDVLDDECPWAEQGTAIFSGTHSTSGISSVPQPGSLVWVAFALGDTSRPVYLGYVRGADDASHLQQADVFDGTYVQQRQTLVGPELAALNSNSVYPYNNVIETASGNVIELDDTAGNERIAIGHNTGSYFEIRPDGAIQIKSIGALYQIINNALNLYVNGAKTQEVTGDDTNAVTGNFTVTAAAINLN